LPGTHIASASGAVGRLARDKASVIRPLDTGQPRNLIHQAGAVASTEHGVDGRHDCPATLSEGEDAAAYSGFEGYDDQQRSLAELLRVGGIDAVDIVGLATDYCVKATAMDAKAKGFSVRVLFPMVADVSPASTANALDQLRAAGVIVHSPGDD
jgi:hypothetical protein